MDAVDGRTNHFPSSITTSKHIFFVFWIEIWFKIYFSPHTRAWKIICYPSPIHHQSNPPAIIIKSKDLNMKLSSFANAFFLLSTLGVETNAFSPSSLLRYVTLRYVTRLNGLGRSGEQIYIYTYIYIYIHLIRTAFWYETAISLGCMMMDRIR